MKVKTKLKIALFVIGLFIQCGIPVASAQLKLPSIFTDNMVLQRNKPIHIWGWGKPKETVEVTFNGETKSDVVKYDRSWRISFDPREADTTGRSLTIRHAGEQCSLKNVLIGDIWLCLGQSNMEWPLEKELHYAEEVNKTDQRLFRFYNPTYAGKNVYNEIFGDSIVRRLNTQSFYQGHWEASNPKTAKDMSAVGYYFGQAILHTTGVPIGLINLAIGGAPLETFISTGSLSESQKYKPKVTDNWLYNDHLPIWVRERGKQNLEEAKSVPEDTLGPNHAYKPGFAYEAGVKSLFPLPIKGIIWYQGESNAQEEERVKEYADLQALMVNDYRIGWKDAQLPFYWAQLSSIDTVNYDAHLWPQFRNEQRKLLSMITNGGMAVTSDIGAKNDVHPRNKKAVGERLARWALFKTYNRDTVPSGPMVQKVEFNKGRLMVTFAYGEGLASNDGMEVHGFSVDGLNPVHAEIQHGKVVIRVQESPKYLYYGWQAWSRGNLVNAAQLPTSTFRMPVTSNQ